MTPPAIIFETLDTLRGAPAMAMHIDAGLDRNGNGRRLWIVFDDDASAVAVVDGYSGTGEVRERFPDIALGVTFKVTPANFKEWQRFGDSLAEKEGRSDGK